MKRFHATRRRLILAVASVSLLFGANASAQTAWPTRPVRLIVPYAVGGPTDLVSRMVAARLGEALGQPVLVDNRPGANANIGAEMAAKAAPDGYTVLLGTGISMGINPLIYPKLNFDVARDFAPVVLMTESMLYLVVNNSVPAKTVHELVNYVKANPGKIAYGSIGNGSVHHLAGETLNLRAGLDMLHVPYKGSAPALQDLVAGRIQVMFDASAIPLVRAGQIRALAVASTKRWAPIPDLPSMAEQGFPDFDGRGWFGLFFPAGVPRPIIDRLNAETNRILRMPDIRERIGQMGLLVTGTTVEEAAAFLKAEPEKWRAVVKASRVRVDD